MQSNPLICNPVVGVCESTGKDNHEQPIALKKSIKKAISLIYFTDPICSACWGIEPQLRKLKLEYGNQIEFEYRMGGLLPDWSYNNGGISKPSDVALHWDEVSGYYEMPIDGDLWLEDPLPSSYPPSIAFKAAQIQDTHKAILFLRELREMVFTRKKNIAKWEHIAEAAQLVELNVEQLKIAIEGKGKELFNEDLKISKELSISGFPTLIFADTLGHSIRLYGSKSYGSMENAMLQLAPTLVKNSYEKNCLGLFSYFKSLTAKEFSVLSDMSKNECENQLDALTKQGKLIKTSIKNGAIWHVKKRK